MSWQNFFATRLFTDIGASDTTITLETAPSVTSGRLVLEARNSSKREIIEYTGVSGNDITGVTRGVGGTSATSHTQNSLVEMNVTAEDLEEALSVPSDIETRFNEVVNDHVAFGLVWTDDTGLTADMSAGVAYINGIRISLSAVNNHAFTASKDTYIDLGDNGVLDYNEEANGAAAPALAANHIRLAKVVTNTTDTTSVVSYRNPAALERADGWQNLGATPDTVTYNGNRSYDLVFNATDLTDDVSVGQRLRIIRGITAPTQCTDLERSSSQYWSDTSLTGLGQTDDITAMAWVKLESYNDMAIISQRTGNNGWDLFINGSDGTFRIHGLVDASNFKLYRSYTSIPLGKWVHIAATMNMSTNTATLYMDGVLVPHSTTATGTANSYTNAGTLYIGSNHSSAHFDGKIAQAAIFSAVLSASTIRSYASQTLAGNETSCVGLWKFNGDANDSNANANNLSANGSAVATATDTPFAGGSVGTTEYGIITAASFSTDTTLTVQAPEGGAIPTSGGVSAVAYSTQKVPYGFPINKNKWIVETQYLGGGAKSSPSGGVYYNVLSGSTAQTTGDIVLPIGAWSVKYKTSVYMSRAAASTAETFIGLSTSYNTAAVKESHHETRLTASTPGTNELKAPAFAQIEVNATSQTNYWLVAANDSGGTSLNFSGYTRIYAELDLV